MSCCLIFQDKDNVYMGADSAISTNIEGTFYRIEDDKNKIFKFDNGIMFCSGEVFYVEKVINSIKNNKNKIELEKISAFLKSESFPKDDFFHVEIILYLYDNYNLYQISEYNNFDIIEYLPPEQGIRLFAIGMNSEKCRDIATQEYKNGEGVVDIFKNTFNKMANEQIGGYLYMYKISKNEAKEYRTKLIEKNIGRL